MACTCLICGHGHDANLKETVAWGGWANTFGGTERMKKEESNFVDVSQLRMGMFVELDVGWMAHPFPTGSFKITQEKQIDTIRSLGIKQVRHIPAKSDPLPAPAEEAVSAAARDDAVERERQQAALAEQQLRQRRAGLLSAQQGRLAACERRFGEALHQYRRTLEQISYQPLLAAQQCQTMVSDFVDEMLGDGESAIRLLTEAAGDKSSMHSVNVTVISLLLGKAMGMGQRDMMDLGVAAFLHDIGKTQLPDRVRWFEDSFSAAESRLYQEHVGQGVQIGRTMELSTGTLLAIAQHHEQVDGSGFPKRIRDQQMTMGARILALVNRYDNLCNPNRPAAALTPHEALSLLFAQFKTRFDSVALSAFIRMMGVYPPGSVVQLADDRYASVVSVNSSRPLKPRVIVYEPGIAPHEALILDLEQVPDVTIRRSLKPASLPAAALDYLAPRQRICYFFESASDSQMQDLHP